MLGSQDLASYRPETLIQAFINDLGLKQLNIAGSRESKEPGIGAWVKTILYKSLLWSAKHPNILGGPGEG